MFEPIVVSARFESSLGEQTIPEAAAVLRAMGFDAAPSGDSGFDARRGASRVPRGTTSFARLPQLVQVSFDGRVVAVSASIRPQGGAQPIHKQMMEAAVAGLVLRLKKEEPLERAIEPWREIDAFVRQVARKDRRVTNIIGGVLLALILGVAALIGAAAYLGSGHQVRPGSLPPIRHRP